MRIKIKAGAVQVEAFLEDILSVCRKHGISISHEDTGGAFLFHRLNDDDVAWIRQSAGLHRRFEGGEQCTE